jgi:hypothetical protein
LRSCVIPAGIVPEVRTEGLPDDRIEGVNVKRVSSPEFGNFRNSYRLRAHQISQVFVAVAAGRALRVNAPRPPGREGPPPPVEPPGMNPGVLGPDAPGLPGVEEPPGEPPPPKDGEGELGGGGGGGGGVYWV